LNRNPIAKVLSTLLEFRVRFLLMGGQACIMYGAAEFSRDIDLALVSSPPNLKKLRAALREMKAEQVYVPRLSGMVLEKGHGCHFRCNAPGVERLRIDVMGRMRGVAPFSRLWARRNDVALPEIGTVSLMSLPDLVSAKKTQREKDWPMIRRLVEADIYGSAGKASKEKARFWLKECRSPELLVELASRFGRLARAEAKRRPLIEAALSGDAAGVDRMLREELERERELDRQYWLPLRKELEQLRRKEVKRRRLRKGRRSGY
jgi:hypothetical protein